MNFLAISPYVFGSNLTWYSIFVLLGAIVTYIISDYFYKKDPESKKCPDLVLNLLLVGFPSGLLGARIWYILSEWEYYSADPIEMLKVWEGGLAIQGGVLLGAGMGIWYAIHKIRKHGMNLKITTLMDMIIPNILIAQVIGRWGNFFNREVYGACVSSEELWFLPTFIKDYMRGGYVSGQYIACSVSQYAQPLFLYEGILNLVGFILISIVARKWFTKRVSGTLSGMYLIWYGTIRACLEGLRNEMFIMRWGTISQSIVTSIVYIILGVAFISYLYFKEYQKRKSLIVEKAEQDETITLDDVAKLNINKDETEKLVKKEVKTIPETKKKKKVDKKSELEENND